jgi:SET domain-containing protein
MSKKKPAPAARAKKKSAPGKPKPAAPLRAATTSEWAHVWQSPIHGRGIRASRDIPSGTRIMEYVGERITKAESERRDAARAAREAEGGDGCVYIFEINQRHDLDGHMEWNTARLINHSCEPNCQSEKVRGRIWISARRDIAAGEELSFDYGFDVENWRQHPCRCGSPKCVGYIVAKSHRWRLRKRLAKLRRATPANTLA